MDSKNPGATGGLYRVLPVESDMDAYREKDGVALSPKEAEWRVKKYKSHRRIPEIIDLTDEDLQELQILQLPQQQPVQENATDYASVDDSDRSDTDSDDSDKEED